MSFVAGAGKINIDMVFKGLDCLPEEGEEVFSRDFTQQMGGGIPATLANLNHLGVPTRLQTALGEDPMSQFARGVLEQFHMNFVNLYAGVGTPYNLTAVMLTEQQRTFVTKSASFPHTKQVDELIYTESQGGKLVQIGLASLDVYRKLKQEGARLLYDTSLRAGLTLENYADVLTLADYYTPNVQEALRLTGSSTLYEAANILSDFFEYVIIKLDRSGCLIFKNDRYAIIPAIPSFVHQDSTGAGDAFMAGLLYGLYYDYSIEESVLMGNITGGKCVTAVGCLSAVCDRDEFLSCFHKHRDEFLSGKTGGWKTDLNALRTDRL